MKRVRAQSSLYTVAGEDYVLSPTTNSERSVPLAERCDPELSIPLVGGSQWAVEGNDTSSSSNLGRAIEDYGMAMLLDTLGDNVTVIKSATRTTSLTDHDFINILTSQDNPNAPGAIRVRRYVAFRHPGVAGVRTSSTIHFERLLADGGVIGTAGLVIPIKLGALAEVPPNGNAHSLIPVPHQDASGRITSATMGGDHLGVTYSYWAEVEFLNATVGRAILSDAQVATLQGAASALTPSEALVPGDYRIFPDPRDTTLHTPANSGEYEGRLNRRWRRTTAGNAPAGDPDIAEVDANWVIIGPDEVAGVHTSFEVPLVSDMSGDIDTGTPVTFTNPDAVLTFCHRTVAGADTDDRRPVRWDGPFPHVVSTEGVALAGNFPNSAAEYVAGTQLQVYAVEIPGLSVSLERFYAGPRALEADPDDLEYDNGQGTIAIGLPAGISSTSDYYANIGIADHNRATGDFGEVGAANVRRYLNQCGVESLGYKSYISNLQRTVEAWIKIHSFVGIATSQLPVLSGTIAGDATQGGTITLAHQSGPQFVNPISHLIVDGTAVTMPVSSGATATAAVVTFGRFAASFVGAKPFRFVRPGVSTRFIPVDTQGNQGVSFLATVPPGNDVRGDRTVYDSAHHVTQNFQSVLRGLEPWAENALWYADFANLSQDCVPYLLPTSATTITVAMWSDADGLLLTRSEEYNADSGLDGDVVVTHAGAGAAQPHSNGSTTVTGGTLKRDSGGVVTAVAQDVSSRETINVTLGANYRRASVRIRNPQGNNDHAPMLVDPATGQAMALLHGAENVMTITRLAANNARTGIHGQFIDQGPLGRGLISGDYLHLDWQYDELSSTKLWRGVVESGGQEYTVIDWTTDPGMTDPTVPGVYINRQSPAAAGEGYDQLAGTGVGAGGADENSPVLVTPHEDILASTDGFSLDQRAGFQDESLLTYRVEINGSTNLPSSFVFDGQFLTATTPAGGVYNVTRYASDGINPDTSDAYVITVLEPLTIVGPVQDRTGANGWSPTGPSPVIDYNSVFNLASTGGELFAVVGLPDGDRDAAQLAADGNVVTIDLTGHEGKMGHAVAYARVLSTGEVSEDVFNWAVGAIQSVTAQSDIAVESNAQVQNQATGLSTIDGDSSVTVDSSATVIAVTPNPDPGGDTGRQTIKLEGVIDS